LPARDGRHAVRPAASLDSLVTLLDVGGFNLLGGDADPAGADSVHARWEERDAVRRAWTAAVGRLEPTSVAWIPVLDYAHARRNPADSSRGARGEGLPVPCALDSALWAEGLAGAYAALGRLAAEQRTLVIGLGLDIDGPHGYSMGQEFCDAAWRRGIAALGDRARLDSLPAGARYAALRDAGLLSRYYRALEDEVTARAASCRCTAPAASPSRTPWPCRRRRWPPAPGPASSAWCSRKTTVSGSPPTGRLASESACRSTAWAACCGGPSCRATRAFRGQ